MIEAGWTSTKPTEAGWYWFRDLSRPYEDEREPYVVKVRQYAQHLAVGNCRLEGAPYGRGEWLGPITPTDRQQGRVEAYTNVLKECEQEASQSFRGGDYQLACRYIAEHCREQLAQQAQDEKGVGDVHK